MGVRQERAHSASLGRSQRCPSPVSATPRQRLICSSGNLPFVQVLLADSNVNARDERGCTPLHLAAAGGFNLVVAALLQAKAKVSMVDNTGWVVFAPHIAPVSQTPFRSITARLILVHWQVDRAARARLVGRCGIRSSASSD